ncbi:hypothetical protein [Georgenia sp. 311]|uniref:hypothetical protein n=1 Tax=Georgenia sp. 311 TaxID=2585134 RepID=UPI00159BC777|nr:hypothetical protein [Georgenia sp. 311]
MRARHVLAVTCTIALLAACGQGGESAQELTWEDSPLAVALGDVWGLDQDPEEWEREEAERQRQVEEAVAACMAEEGFEYTPAVYDGGSSVVIDEDDDWGSEEWTAQYGYGITTDPWLDEQPVEPEEEWVDPNQEYVEAMSPSEQDAYYEALHGAPMLEEDWVEGDPEPEYDWEDAGCYGSAQHTVYEESDPAMQMWEDPAFTEFFAATEKVWEDAARDPRTIAVNLEWAECMEAAGITGMTSPDLAQEAIYTEYDRLMEKADAEIDWESIDWESLPEGADPMRDLMEEQGLAELREREIAQAVADLACREEADVEARLMEIQFELEEEVVETYQSDIDAIIATYGQES